METHSGYNLPLGPTNVDRLVRDPKCFGFFLSRYKFAAKMMRDCISIIDIGCGDGIGTLMMLSETRAEMVVGVDMEPRNIAYAHEHLVPAVRALRPADSGRDLQFVLGMFDYTEFTQFYGVVCLDVIEHIESDHADAFIHGLCEVTGSIAVIGTPSLASSPYASEHSRVGHINLYDADRLRESLQPHFREVFMFSMNDEMVHTGFDKLAHYLIGVCVK